MPLAARSFSPWFKHFAVPSFDLNRTFTRGASASLFLLQNRKKKMGSPLGIVNINNLRVAFAGLGVGKIYAGVPSKDMRSFQGAKKDVTSDCVKAVFEKLEKDSAGSSLPMLVGPTGKPVWEVTIRRIAVSLEKQ
jgi:hypothetical protein